jgi:hypothetical protein
MGLSFTIVAGPSPAGLMTIFNCLRFETPPTLMATSPYLHPPGTGCPGYTPRHWVPFSSPPTTRRATVEVFDPASTLDNSQLLLASGYITLVRATQKSHPLPRNGCPLLLRIRCRGICLLSRCLAMGVCVKIIKYREREVSSLLFCITYWFLCFLD